jgi:hypothetical protein
MSEFHTTCRVVNDDEANYTAEARLVQSRAGRGEPSVIRLNAIVFFSTTGGDAWMFDVDDGQAACLARAGQPAPIPIEETDTKLLVAWQAHYRIEGDTFTVIERDGSTRSFTGYPTTEIRRHLDDSADQAQAEVREMFAVMDRLQHTGRNDPCPCGSGKKYKRCCLDRDETRVRRARAESAAALARSSAPASAADDSEPPDEEQAADHLPSSDEVAPDADAPDEVTPDDKLTPDEQRRLDEAWREFDAAAQPTTEQMDTVLGRLLALPPEATDWNDLVHLFAEKKHADLPGAFRRIVAGVPATKATGLIYVCWGALEELTERERIALMPDIVACCRKLDGSSYDSEAVQHVQEFALAAGCEAEALALAEHFLPILRTDAGLFDWVVPEACREIFELRVGARLRETGGAGVDTEALARELRRGMEEEIDAGYTAHAVRVIGGGGFAEPWTRSDFALTDTEAVEGSPEWRAALRRFETLMQVAREAWQLDGHPPGCAFRELQLLVDAAHAERAEAPDKRKQAPKNLLDCLHGRIESRVARSSRSLLGINVPRARLLLHAHRHLLRFARRHGLIDAAAAAKTDRELDRLVDGLRS